MTSSTEGSRPGHEDGPGDRQDLRDFLDRTLTELSVPVMEDPRFPTGKRLHNRFEAAIARLFTDGWQFLQEVVEVHNEICTAGLILQARDDPQCTGLEYEPSMPSCTKRFDFCAEFNGVKSK